MHILLPSDVFPPGSVGGAAWSAHTLALALIQRSHTVSALVPRSGVPGLSAEYVLGVPTINWGYRAPRLPFVENYFRHEAFWSPFAEMLVREGQLVIHQRNSYRPEVIIHAQHVQTIPAAVIAGQRLGVPVVATVRDHWPWDYFATGLHANRVPYPQPTWASLCTDLPARLGALRGVLALPMLPYLLTHVQRRAALLRRADAVIAVSHYMARRLAPLVPATRLHVIPNMVDPVATEQMAATPPRLTLSTPFLLFVGKLERNKGVELLVDIFRALIGQKPLLPGASHTHFPYPLVVAGTGTLKLYLEQELTRLGVRMYCLDWTPRAEVLRLLARCEVLLFPSTWGEPLSRVLLEASMLGTAIVAMPTGGTSDIIADGVTGLLAATPEQFAQRLHKVLSQADLRQRLRQQARDMARQRFAVEVVVPQVEAVYRTLLDRRC